MEDYVNYLSLLGEASGSVAALCGFLLAGMAMTWLCGAWITQWLVSEDPANGNWDARWLWLHPAILAAGWATLIAVSTASLYLTRGMVAAKFMLVVVAALSCMALWRRKPRLRMQRFGLFAAVGASSLALGFWQYAATGLPVGEGVDYLAFSDLHLDLPIHAGLAGLMLDSGLPLINQWASSTDQYNALTHIGHAVSIAAYSSVLGITLYSAAAVSWILATVLIAWAALALLSSGDKVGRGYAVVVVAAALAIGQFTLPWLHDPANPRAPLNTGIWVASRSYWNISQAISIALTMGALVMLERYGSYRRKGEPRKTILAASVGVIAVAGLVKPSLVVFYGPALFIWLAVNRARVAEYLVTLIVLQTGVLVYFLPRIQHALPANPSWSMASDPTQWVAVALFLWHACLSVAIILACVLVRSIRRGWSDRRWQVIDLAAIALGGSILFALLFREDRFVGFIVMQPNIWWGISACLVLLVPLAGREALELLRSGRAQRWLAAAALLVAGVQLANGLHVALVYPVLNPRQQDASLAETLDTARNMTPEGTRFALDLSLEHLDLRPFLARPSLLRTSYANARDRQAYMQWRSFLRKRNVGPPVDHLDAVILRRDHARANGFFDRLGWQAASINDRYTLWQRTYD